MSERPKERLPVWGCASGGSGSEGGALLLASVSEKGQVTIPKEVRSKLGIKPHTLVGFRLIGGKAQLMRVEIHEEEPYTEEELDKIQKLAKQKGGKTFKNPKKAIDYLHEL